MLNGQKLQGPPTAAEINTVLKEKGIEEKCVQSIMQCVSETLYSFVLLHNSSTN